MSRTIKLFKNHRTLYFAIGSTLAMFLYAKIILGHFSRGFTIDVGSNSLGLSFYYTLDMVQNFFELKNRTQLLCYRQFLQIWDIIFALVYTLTYASWIKYFLKKQAFIFDNSYSCYDCRLVRELRWIIGARNLFKFKSNIRNISFIRIWNQYV